MFTSSLTDPSFPLLRNAGYINGQWIDAQNNATFDVTNPATGALITRVSDLGAAETRIAVDAAEKALPGWRSLTGKERAHILRNWFNLIIENREELAQILSLEQGKPLTESRGEITYGASFIEWFAEEGKRIYGETIPATQAGQRIVTIRQPIGVVGAVTPWNFPNAMITRKVGPALAAGCTIVLKPAAETPLSALALAALGEQAGIPAGVFYIVTGVDAAAIGGELTANPVVRKISFTGSTRVGKLLMAQSAETVKKLSLELGGNAPFIVFDDADLDAAVTGAMAAKFRNSGQTCVCANRFYVQDAVYDAFAAKLTAAVKALHIAPATDEKSQQGPLINDAAVRKVREHILDAVSKGATVLTGGKPAAQGGLFFEPTVLANVTADMTVTREETFGPLAPLVRFTDEAEVIQAANNSEFGLAAYFYSRDIGRVYRVAEALEAGMVGINEGILSTEVAPFGGIKQSGLGREGSRHGIDDYLEIKYLCFGGIN